MAKKMKKFLALVLALTLCLVQIAIPVSAAGPNNWWNPGWFPGGGNNEPNQIEYYQVYLQGNLIASDSSSSYYFLGTHYTAGASVNGNTLSWYINPVGGDSGNFGGSVNLTDYIVIPEGFTVSKFNVAESTVDGVNDPNTYMYDNCIIHITIETIYNEETGEEIPVPDPTMTDVTVIHNYYTKDLYTNESVLDGTSTTGGQAYAGESFTASPVTSYNGTEYAQTTDASALTITVSEDAAQNVITVNYLRTIDTTPKATSVTVIHNYYTEDVYTGITALDGTSSVVAAATEFDTYTASPIASYNGNAYAMTTDASALTISVVADAAQNVITVNYLRTIDTTPKATSVTVIHNYYTEDVYTEETKLDGTSSVVAAATEFDTYTASPVTAYGGNDYEMTSDASALTISVVADAEQNVITINYLRTIDTAPKNTTVTVIHNYYTEDVYTEETVKDGDATIISEAIEHDSFTATPITQFDGNEYEMTTGEDDLTITIHADAEKNLVVINYLRTVDSTPIDYEPSVSITKTADKEIYEVDEIITWTITVTNTSDYTAYDVVVTDEMVDMTWTVEELAAGESETFTAYSKAEAAGELTNVAVVDWTDNDELEDADEDEVTTETSKITVTVEEPEEEPTEEPTEPEEEEPAAPPAENPTENEEPAPAPQNPPAQNQPAQNNQQQVPQAGAALVDIFDEDVPLADVPETGDVSLLWVAMSLLSGGGAFVLKRKEK